MAEKEVSDFQKVLVKCLSNVNKCQYFLPGLSWFFVYYAYKNIGEGKIWKYLYFVTSAQFLASIIANFQDCFTDVLSVDVLFQFKYIEGLLWGINEFGFVYISYMKLYTVIAELRKKYWNYILGGIFLFVIIARFHLSYCFVAGRSNDAGAYKHGLAHYPLGLIELIFMVFIVIEMVNDSHKGNKLSKGIVSTMLNSSLSRMFLVSFIFIGCAALCSFGPPDYMKGFKNIVWRAKAVLGLIFMLDLLLIRIELHNQISKHGSSARTKNSQISNPNIGNNVNPSLSLSSGKMNTLNSSSKEFQSKFNNNVKYLNDDYNVNMNMNMNNEMLKMASSSNEMYENNEFMYLNNKTKNSNKYFNQLQQF